VKFVKAAAALVLFFATLPVAAAQVITASVEGIVLDPGAAVPGAKVRAHNTSTNLERALVEESSSSWSPVGACPSIRAFPRR
jgi:hypothetical protein